MKHQIKHRVTGVVLFEADLPGDLPGGMAARHALEQAVEAGANLRGANLCGANLYGADLCGASLGEGKKLIGKRPILTIGPIGLRSDNLMAFITEAGILLKAGCFFGTVEEFKASLAEKHGDNDHAREYAAALAMIQAHAEIWTPKQSEAPDVAA